MCATFMAMSRSLHVRLDNSAAAALDVIRSDGLSDSEAVRAALREAAARRLARSSIAAEVLSLATDASDRAEMAAVREQMAELAPEDA
jgi:Arc/MetJ-type ribon-helix-helix transcriptional regulator